MKKLFILFVFALLAQLTFSQVYKGGDAEKLAAGADMVRIKEDSHKRIAPEEKRALQSLPAYIRLKKGYSLNAEEAVIYTKKLAQSQNIDFTLKNVQNNKPTREKSNRQTYRYIQTIGGYPVEFSMWNVHVSNGKVDAMNGDIIDAGNMQVVFSISEQQALQSALAFIGAEKYMWEDAGAERAYKEFKDDANATYYPKGEKVIVPDKVFFRDSELKSAYKFNIYSMKPYDRKMVYVDAQTGKVILDMPLLRGQDVVGTAHTGYSGIREINTYKNSETEYILLDNTRGLGIKTLNCQMSTGLYNNVVDFKDDDNIWNNVNAQLDQYATDGHWATMMTFDYYLNVHGRNSIDGAGHKLWSYVHYNLMAEGYGDNVNAFWNGEFMTYGDGNAASGVTPLTTLDICGHEITHGLTERTADLVYRNEPGALNESFSDILGTAVEFYARPENANWTNGEDIGDIIRSLEDPKAYSQPDTYGGTNWYTGWGDNGGVHINSGVLNYWFYLLSVGGTGTNDLGNAYTVTGIGIEKAELIAFKTLVEYLSPNSEYDDAYFYAMQAATDIYGSCTTELTATGNAFYAVGVAPEEFPEGVLAAFQANATLSNTVPFAVTFTNNSFNASDYLWDFGDGNTSTLQNPTHTYTDFGTYTVTLTADGGDCGIEEMTKTDYITIDEDIAITTMSATGTNTIESCIGIVYDPGGPNANYPNNSNGVLIIHSEGATQINVTITDFNIEGSWNGNCGYDYIQFFEGNGTSSTNLGKYCNDTGNPGTITAEGEYLTIRFYSDGSSNFAGFALSYQCVKEATDAPVAEFSADKTESCDGAIAFTDESENDPTEWAWDFGDGNTSTLQNPSHTYLVNGTYTVELTATNGIGDDVMSKTDYIMIAMPTAPVIGEITAYNNASFVIDLDLDGTAYWYESMTDATPVYVGNYWEHPAITEITTYFVREAIEEGSETCMSEFTEVVLDPVAYSSIRDINGVNGISVSPNPGNGVYQLKGIDNSSEYVISVSDATGKAVLPVQPLTSTIIDITGAPEGIYFLKVSSAKETKVVKLIYKK